MDAAIKTEKNMMPSAPVLETSKKKRTAPAGTQYIGDCLCGNPIFQKIRGRPREHCSRECGRVWSAVNTLQLFLCGGKSRSGLVVVSEEDAYVSRATREGWKEMRSILFTLANTRCPTKGRKVRRLRDDRGRFRYRTTKEHTAAVKVQKAKNRLR